MFGHDCSGKVYGECDMGEWHNRDTVVACFGEGEPREVIGQGCGEDSSSSKRRGKADEMGRGAGWLGYGEIGRVSCESAELGVAVAGR